MEPPAKKDALEGGDLAAGLNGSANSSTSGRRRLDLVEKRADLLHTAAFLDNFIILPKTKKARLARLVTYSRQLQALLRGALGSKGQRDRLAMGECSLGDMVTNTGLRNPDHAGWLHDCSSARRVWGVLADMVFCVFPSPTDETPLRVVLLPGHSIGAIVYNSAKEDVLPDVTNSTGVKDRSRSNMRTISGINRFQFTVDDPMSGVVHSFGTSTVPELEEWVSLLRVACNLDLDLFGDSGSDMEQNVSSCESTSSVSPNLADTSRQEDGKTRTDTHPLNKLAFTSQRSSPSSPTELSTMKSGYQPPSPSQRTRLQRRKSINESSTSSTNSDQSPEPLFSKVSRSSSCQNICENKKRTTLKRQSSFEKLKSFLTSPFKSHSSSKNSLSDKHQSSSGASSAEACSEAPHHQPERAHLSHTDNKSASLPAYLCESAFRLINGENTTSSGAEQPRRTSAPASPLAGRFSSKSRSSKSSKPSNTPLGELQEVSHCGALLHKQMFRWSKVFCAVSRAVFHVYKSERAADSPLMSIPLPDCTLSLLDTEKTKKLYVFKLCQLNARGLYFSAGDMQDFSGWLDVLRASTSQYEGFHALLVSPRSSKVESSSSQGYHFGGRRRFSELPERPNIAGNFSFTATRLLTKSTNAIPGSDSRRGAGLDGQKQVQPVMVARSETQLGSGGLEAECYEEDRRSSSSINNSIKAGVGLMTPPVNAGMESGFSSWSEHFCRSHSFSNSPASPSGSESPSGGGGDTDSETTLDSVTDESQGSQAGDTPPSDRAIPAGAAEFVAKYTVSSQRHDYSLKEVWRNDTGKQLQKLRNQLDILPARKDVTKTTDIFNRDLPGPDNQGLLLLVTEDDNQLPQQQYHHQQQQQHKPPPLRHQPHIDMDNDDEEDRQLHMLRRRSLSDGSLAVPGLMDHLREMRDGRAPPAASAAAAAAAARRSGAGRGGIDGRGPREPQPAPEPAASRFPDAVGKGHLERRSSLGAWERVWCLLARDDVVYVYSGPEAESAQDSLPASHYTVQAVPDTVFEQRPFCFQMEDEEHFPEYFSAENAEELSEWLDRLRKTCMRTSLLRSPEAEPPAMSLDGLDLQQSSEMKAASRSGLSESNELQWEQNLLHLHKHQLLDEVNQQKQQLTRTHSNPSPSETLTPVDQLLNRLALGRLVGEPGPSSQQQIGSLATGDEQKWKELMVLKQRKISTQLKLDSAQKALQSHNKSQKSHKSKKFTNFMASSSSSSQQKAVSQGVASMHAQQVAALGGATGACGVDAEKWLQGQTRELSQELSHVEEMIRQKEQRTNLFLALNPKRSQGEPNKRSPLADAPPSLRTAANSEEFTSWDSDFSSSRDSEVFSPTEPTPPDIPDSKKASFKLPSFGKKFAQQLPKVTVPDFVKKSMGHSTNNNSKLSTITEAAAGHSSKPADPRLAKGVESAASNRHSWSPELLDSLVGRRSPKLSEMRHLRHTVETDHPSSSSSAPRVPIHELASSFKHPTSSAGGSLRTLTTSNSDGNLASLAGANRPDSGDKSLRASYPISSDQSPSSDATKGWTSSSADQDDNNNSPNSEVQAQPVPRKGISAEALSHIAAFEELLQQRESGLR